MSVKLEFCAVMGLSAARAAAEAPWGVAAGLHLREHGGLAAAFAPVAGGFGLRALLSARDRRRDAGRALVARAALLEKLMLAGDLLPAAPGVRLAPDQAPRALAANAALLGAALGRLAGRVQHQVRIAWNPAAALGRFSDAPELAAARAACADRAALGAALGQGAEALRARLGGAYAARIAAQAEEVAALPLDGPDGLVNLVCLGDAAAAVRLEATLEAIDAEWPDGLTIKLIGPSPVVSFAALSFDTPAEAALAAALRTLGLGPDPEPDAVNRAFRARARALHPDAGGPADGGAALAALRAAASLTLRAGAARRALRAAGLPEGAAPLAALRREGAAGPAAEAAA